MSIFSRKREEELQDRIEELQILIIELEDENTFLVEELEMKNEIISSLRAKMKRMEKRIERMLWELRISDEMIFRKVKEDEDEKPF